MTLTGSDNLPVLAIEDLTVGYQTRDGVIDAVRDVSLEIRKGQTYGLVGESGSGKSTLALAVMHYLSANGAARKGSITFNGRDLLNMSTNELRQVWGKEIALVPQDPFSSLNPSIKIGEQLAEALRLHSDMNANEAKTHAVELLKDVRIADPENVADKYPHQVSGGMQQRVMIAMALSTEPTLLVLDEPTTALDVTTEAAVLDLFRELVYERQTSALYVTHNLGVVAGISDRVAVLYASELVEDAPTEDLFAQPLHPYTRGLLDSVPRLGQRKDERPLQGIPGSIPGLQQLPTGCVYADRCPLAIDICFDERPPLDTPVEGRRVRCHRWPEILSGEIDARRADVEAIAVEDYTSQPLLDLDDVEVHYPVNQNLVDAVRGKTPPVVKAVDGVDLTVGTRRTLGIVGESGSGKTSLARAIIGLVARTGGEIELLDMALPPELNTRGKDVLKHLQIVFQNPDEALNPHMTVGEILRRPFVNLLEESRQGADEKVAELLEAVRLPAQYTERLPPQLSGGEKQRVAIARAFAANPDLMLADEPVSALDVSVQASVLNLLNELQIENSSTTLFISHDIGVVAYLSDEIAVMYLGNLMEVTDADQLFDVPYHPYTEALLSAVPAPDPSVKQERIRLDGDIPSAIDVPTGCPFHTRCPRFLGDICVDEKPPWQTAPDGKRIYCHIPVEELMAAQKPVVKFED